jgi:hypothetical protein
MHKETDPLEGEITISAELSETGLSINTKSRALYALDRLMGNVINIPNPYLERIASTARLKTEIKHSLLTAETRAAEKKLEDDSAFEDLLIENFCAREAKKLENVKAVSMGALDLLQDDGHTDEIDDTKTEIDDDWLNTFERYAQDASTKRFRQLWSAILSGEIRKPQSFSLTTLRFTSELDAHIATLFEKTIASRSSDGFILKPDNLTGQTLLDYSFLEEVGLLHHSLGHLKVDLEKDQDGQSLYRIGNFILKVKSKNNISIPVIRITRVGKEISSIITKADDKAFLKQISDKLNNQLESSEIHQIIKIGNAEKIILVEKLK